MSPSARSYYAALTGAVLLVVLLALIAGWTIPELLR